jgi:hypothetical protein
MNMAGWLWGPLEMLGLPAAILTALAAAVAMAIVLLHLLRRRAVRVPVSFLPLWDLAAKGPAPGRPALGLRPRRWWALVFALAVLALIVIAAADPRPTPSASRGAAWVLLVDVSAPMAAGEGGRTRLDRAREIASDLLERRGPADRVLLAAFASEAVPLTGLTGDGRTLSGALSGLGIEASGPDLERALAFAADVVAGPRALARGALASPGGPPVPARIFVVGAGPYPRVSPELAARLAGVEVTFLTVATAAADNVALAAFAVRRRPGAPRIVDLSARVENFGRREVAVDLRLGSKNAGEAALLRRRLTIAARAHHDVVAHVTLPSSGGDELTASITAGGNALAIDDVASVRVLPFSPWRILTIGPRNLYLEGAWLSFGDEVAARTRPAAELEASRPTWTRYDLVVFDAVTPQPPPVEGRYLYIAPQYRKNEGGARDHTPFVAGSTLTSPVITDVAAGHVLARHLPLEDLNVRRAWRATAYASADVVASSLGQPLFLARRGPDHDASFVALAFDLRDSDLPLRPGLPLLLANTLEYLAAPARARQEDRLARALVPMSFDLQTTGLLPLAGATRTPPPRVFVASWRRWPWRGALTVALVLLTPAWLGPALARRRGT